MEGILTWAFNHPYGFAIGIIGFFLSIFGATALWLYREEIKAWLKQKTSAQPAQKSLLQPLSKDKTKTILPAAAKLQKFAKSSGIFISKQWQQFCQFLPKAKSKLLQILPKRSEAPKKEAPPQIQKHIWKQKAIAVYNAAIAYLKKAFILTKGFIIKNAALLRQYMGSYYQKLRSKLKGFKKSRTIKKPPKAVKSALDELSKEDILAALTTKPDKIKEEDATKELPSSEEQEQKVEPAETLLDGFVPLSLSREVTYTQKRPPHKFVYLSGTFHKTYKNWALALSSPYLMAFQKPIDQFSFETQTLLKMERITNRVQLFNHLEKLRVGFIRHEHDRLAKRISNLNEEDKDKFLHKHQGHHAYAKFQYIAKNPQLYQNADFLVFDTILAVSLVREACSPEVQLLTEDEAKMLLYRLVYPLYQKAYGWSKISDYFRAGLHLYYAKSTRLTKRLSENLDELFENPQSPWVKLGDMNYHLDKSEYKIYPPVLSEQQFDIYLSDWFKDFYGSQTSYQEALYMVKRASSVEDFCSFINSFSYGLEYLSFSVLKPIGDNLGLYEHELRALAAGFILLGSDYIKDLMSEPDYALTKASEYLLYCNNNVVLPYVCFGLCCDSLAQSVQQLFETCTQEGQNLFGLNITLEELAEVKEQALELSYSYSSDWNDYPQFTAWLHYQMQNTE